MRIDVGLENATAELVGDANAALADVDRAKSFASIALRMLFNREQFGPDLITAIDRVAQDRASARSERYGKSTVFLVLRYKGVIEFEPKSSDGDLGQAVFAIDAVDKVALRKDADRFFANVVAAIGVLEGDHSQDLESVEAGIAFMLPDSRPLYSLSLSGGKVRASTGRRPTEEDLVSIGSIVKQLRSSPRWQTPSRLFAEALRQSHDRLEAFILLWGAIEMTISKATSGYESGTWVVDVPEARRESAKAFHAAWAGRGWRTYAFVDKVDALLMRYNIRDAEDMKRDLLQIKTQVREPLYHEGQFDEDALPIEKCMRLARKLINAVLDER